MCDHIIFFDDTVHAIHLQQEKGICRVNITYIDIRDEKARIIIALPSSTVAHAMYKKVVHYIVIKLVLS